MRSGWLARRERDGHRLSDSARGRGVAPAGAAGLRVSGFLVVSGRDGQAGRGMAAMFAKTATSAAAQGQDVGTRSRRRRAARVSREGTCRNR